MLRSLLVLGVFTLMQPALGQSQREYDFINDYGDGSVQTFVAEGSVPLEGVELVVFAHGAGADTTIHIRDLLPDGRLDTEILATGVLSASELPRITEEWRFIRFDDPVTLTVGEDYGLVINQFGSGPSGYNSYGVSRNTPYGNGEFLFESRLGARLVPTFPTVDLAFAFVVPEPTSAMALLVAAACGIGLSRRRGYNA